MFELEEFCSLYLPQFFLRKFESLMENGNYVNFNSSSNVYELASRMAALVDLLISACPEFKASPLIKQYFMFDLKDFSIHRRKSYKQKNEGRRTIHEILETLDEIPREMLIIFTRIVYTYFLSREKSMSPSINKQIDQNIDDISALYHNLKLKTMTDDECVNLPDFMDYAFCRILSLKPSERFFEFVRAITEECDFAEKIKQSILGKVSGLQTQKQQVKEERKKTQAQSLNSRQKREEFLIKDTQKKTLASSSANQEEKAQLTEPKTCEKSSLSRSEVSSSVISSKESSIEIQQLNSCSSLPQHSSDDRKSQFSNKQNRVFESLKQQSSGPLKGRTILFRQKSRFVPKKVNPLPKSLNETNLAPGMPSELFLKSINQTISKRFLSYSDDSDDDDDDSFLVEATPKPKKMPKLDRTRTEEEMFDQNDNFIGL